jgi:hypothetical protein
MCTFTLRPILANYILLNEILMNRLQRNYRNIYVFPRQTEYLEITEYK